MNVFYYSNPDILSERIFENGNGVENYCKHLTEKQSFSDPTSELKAIDLNKGYVKDTIKENKETITRFLSSIGKIDSMFIGSLMLMNPTRVLYVFKNNKENYLFSMKEDDVKYVHGKEYKVEQVDLCNI